MVFWSSLLKRIKENVPGPEFLKLKKKVEKNTTDISANLEKINTNTQSITNNTNAINATNETVNTNSASIQNINSNAAFKNQDNVFTRNCSFTADNVKIGRVLYCGANDNEGDIWILPKKTSGKRTIRIGNSPRNDDQRYDLNMEERSFITNLPNPTLDLHAANKRYVDSKFASVPSPDLSNYLTKTEAQADYGRCKDGISNDWYSTNTFRKTPQLISAISNPKDLVNKEYIDGIISTGGTLYIKETTYTHTGPKTGVSKYTEMTKSQGDALTNKSKVLGVYIKLSWLRSGELQGLESLNWEGYTLDLMGNPSNSYGAAVFTDTLGDAIKVYCYWDAYSDPYITENLDMTVKIYHI